jgi:excisionase family DNA binding protein
VAFANHERTEVASAGVIPRSGGGGSRTGVCARPTSERLLDTAGLEERLGVGERFVRRLVNERRIPYLKIGRHVRFDAAGVDAWIRDNRVEAMQPVTSRAMTSARW